MIGAKQIRLLPRRIEFCITFVCFIGYILRLGSLDSYSSHRCHILQSAFILSLSKKQEGNNMKKQILSFVLAITMLFALTSTAFASSFVVDTSLETTNSAQNDLLVTIPISTNAEGMITNSATAEDTVLAITIIRNGNTETCEVYLYWSGSDYYNAWKFTECEVCDAGILFWKDVYGTISGTTKYVTAAATGSVKLGEVSIPTDITEAKANISGLQGYCLSTASWRSALIVGKMADIN